VIVLLDSIDHWFQPFDVSDFVAVCVNQLINDDRSFAVYPMHLEFAVTCSRWA